MKKQNHNVVSHPTMLKVFQESACRWLELRKTHAIACDRLWAGTIASQFTEYELSLLGDYLSPHDRELIVSVRQEPRRGDRRR